MSALLLRSISRNASASASRRRLLPTLGTGNFVLGENTSSWVRSTSFLSDQQTKRHYGNESSASRNIIHQRRKGNDDKAGSIAIPLPVELSPEEYELSRKVEKFAGQNFGGSKNSNKSNEKENKSGGGSGGGGGGGGNNNNSNVPTCAYISALTAILGLYVVSHIDDEAEESAMAIDTTWTELIRLVHDGKVDRIVITDDNSVARIYVMEEDGGKEGIENVVESEAQEDVAQDDVQNASTFFTNDTQVQFGDGKAQEALSDPASKESPTSIWNPTTFHHDGIEPPLKAPSHHTHHHEPTKSRNKVYKLNIDQSFEVKLENMQREYNISRANYIPVQYSPNTTTESSPILTAAGRLAIIGAVAAMARVVTKRGGFGESGAGGGGGSGGYGTGFPGMGGSGGGSGGIGAAFGQSNAKKFCSKEISINFRDVAGCREAKREVMEFVDFLQDATRFTKLGAKIPKGALLCGPPGTGKTLLAKAVAGEAGVPFYSVSGSDFVEMFVGVGPSRVRDLFKEARSNSPCIIFIDEIDAIGRKRSSGGFSSGNDERENTLNQLLVEMDGFNPSSGVVVLAGTNRVDILDDALTRPGRFDRQILVDRPDLQGRKEIFQVHLKGITLDGEPDDIAGRLAGLTPGFAGADISNLCNEAAIVAARRKAESVSVEDFEKATDRVIGGLESTKILSQYERAVVAHHEAGHAVAGWFLKHADPILMVTIIPRSSGALGFAQYLPNEVFLQSEKQIMDKICMALAGRAAEEICFGEFTTGASDDLRKVTDLVFAMIQTYGMNDSVGQLALAKDSAQGDKRYSDATAAVMDEEARRIVDEAYKRTLELMRKKKNEVEQVADMLLQKETIAHDDLQELLGARCNEQDSYGEYLSSRKGTGTVIPDESDDLEDLAPGFACTGKPN